MFRCFDVHCTLCSKPNQRPVHHRFPPSHTVPPVGTAQPSTAQPSTAQPSTLLSTKGKRFAPSHQPTDQTSLPHPPNTQPTHRAQAARDSSAFAPLRFGHPPPPPPPIQPSDGKRQAQASRSVSLKCTWQLVGILKCRSHIFVAASRKLKFGSLKTPATVEQPGSRHEGQPESRHEEQTGAASGAGHGEQTGTASGDGHGEQTGTASGDVHEKQTGAPENGIPPVTFELTPAMLKAIVVFFAMVAVAVTALFSISQANLSALTDELALAKTSLQSVRENVAVLKGNVDSFRYIVDQVNKEATDIRKQMGEINQDLGTILEIIDRNPTELLRNVDNIASTARNLTGRISILEDDASTLEAQLKQGRIVRLCSVNNPCNQGEGWCTRDEDCKFDSSGALSCQVPSFGEGDIPKCQFVSWRKLRLRGNNERCLQVKNDFQIAFGVCNSSASSQLFRLANCDSLVGACQLVANVRHTTGTFRQLGCVDSRGNGIALYPCADTRCRSRQLWLLNADGTVQNVPHCTGASEKKKMCLDRCLTLYLSKNAPTASYALCDEDRANEQLFEWV